VQSICRHAVPPVLSSSFVAKQGTNVCVPTGAFVSNSKFYGGDVRQGNAGEVAQAQANLRYWPAAFLARARVQAAAFICYWNATGKIKVHHTSSLLTSNSKSG